MEPDPGRAALPDAAVGVGPAAAGVVEMRPIENLRVCPACLVSNNAEDAFCTACGSPLAVSELQTAVAPAVEAPPAKSPSDVWPQPGPSTGVDNAVASAIAPSIAEAARPRHRWRILLLAFVAVLALGAASAFAVLWRTQVGRTVRAEASLDSTQAKLRSTKAQLASTTARLSEASALASRRRAVLLRAQNVLLKVDPLLSSVDAIQNRAADIQNERDVFTGDSDTLTSTMITLGNYLLQTSSDVIGPTYLSSLIDQANSELATVQTDEANLTSADSGYTSASHTFSSDATAFSASVRQLQRELKKATGP